VSSRLIAGDGAFNLDLNGGILRANRNEADFLQGFTLAPLVVGTEGAWVDSNGHTIGISTAFSGTSTFNKLGVGTLIMSGNSSTFTGDTSVQAGTLQVDGMIGGLMDVMTGARLTGIGQVGTTTNSGAIAPGQPNSFGTLTIAGDYVAAGGSIEIRTRLGDDSSLTDRLVITGSTSGSTPILVTNIGGLGAQTTEGIKIIDVVGASNGNFTLLGTTAYQGDQAVVAGAYAYRLYQGGTSTPADGDWYLRSALQDAPAGTPLYQPGVPSYEAYPQILLGLNGMPTLQQRVGNRFWSPNNASNNNEDYVAGSFTESNGMWLRMEGGHNRIDPKSSTVGSTYKYDMIKMQGGLDAVLAEYKSGKLVGGLTAHYVHGKADTSWRYGGASDYGAGSISTDGYGIGSTLTWYGDSGFYVDSSVQATLYRSDLSARPGHRLKKNNEALGYAASVETGKRLPLNQEWFVTPQAQLTYSKASFDHFTDNFGSDIRSGRDDSLQGRLGISIERQVNRTHIYGVANIYNEFLNGTSILIENQAFKNRHDQLWAGIGFGWSYNWSNDKFSIYGKGMLNTSLANSDSYGYSGTVGFRANW
jgi:outer membrane autotransporter protein